MGPYGTVVVVVCGGGCARLPFPCSPWCGPGAPGEREAGGGWDCEGGVPRSRWAPAQGSPVRCAVVVTGLAELLVSREGWPGAGDGSMRTAENAKGVSRRAGVGGRGPNPTLVCGLRSRVGGNQCRMLMLGVGAAGVLQGTIGGAGGGRAPRWWSPGWVTESELLLPRGLWGLPKLSNCLPTTVRAGAGVRGVVPSARSGVV